MGAPEIGQAAAIAAKKKREEEAQAAQEATDGAPEGAPENTTSEPSQPANAAPAGTQEPVDDGTLALEELPDEDLFALATSQKIQLPEPPEREKVIEALNAEGITRVLAPPAPAPPAEKKNTKKSQAKK
jgi:hypothetical protein